jgi:putative FmdB family regulatory protein
MPSYDYKCEHCGHIQEVIHRITEDPVIPCPKCMNHDVRIPMVRQISGGYFNLGSTETMAWREKRQRTRNNAALELKQMERYGKSSGTLVPNVDGETTESWSDAAKLARDKGKDTMTYQSKIVEEKSTSKESGVNDKKWKAAKDKLDKS